MNTVELNRLVPIYTHETRDKFIDSRHNQVTKVNLDGKIVYNTAPLATHRDIDLLAISSSSTLLEMGVLEMGVADLTDIIQPHVSLTSMFISLSSLDQHTTNEAIELDVSSLPNTTFYFTRMENGEINKEFILDFVRKDLVISRHTKQYLYSGTKPTSLDKDLCINLDVGLALKLNIATGELKFQSAYASVNDVELKDKLSVTVLGYVLSAYRHKKNNNINQ